MPSTATIEIELGGAPRARGERFRVALRLLRHWALAFFGLFVTPPERSRERRRRIAFQAYSAHLAQFYATVIAELRRQPDVEVELVILPHPHLPLAAERELRSFARERLGLSDDQIVPYWRTLWRRFDALVCADVYARFPLRRCPRILLRHGPGTNRRHVIRRRFRKTLFDFDLALVPGEHDREVLAEAVAAGLGSRRRGIGGGRGARIVASGQPFLDRLGERAAERESYLAALGLDRARPIVLFAPSWSGLRGLPGRGVPYWDEVVASLQGLGANVVIKLHDCSYRPSMAGGVDWTAKLAAVAAPRLAIDRDIDDVPALEHADVLVTDVSSRAFNFMLLGKPVVLWCASRAPVGDWDRERETLMRRGSLVAESIGDVTRLVSGALARDLRADDAGAVSAKCFSNAGSATSVVVDLLRAELDLPATSATRRDHARPSARPVVADVAARQV